MRQLQQKSRDVGWAATQQIKQVFDRSLGYINPDKNLDPADPLLGVDRLHGPKNLRAQDGRDHHRDVNRKLSVLRIWKVSGAMHLTVDFMNTLVLYMNANSIGSDCPRTRFAC